MLRSLPFAGVLLLGGLTAFSASAQRYDDGQYRPDPRQDDGRYRGGDYRDDDNPGYDYARVVRVDPIIVDDGPGRGGRCYQRSDGGYVDSGRGYDDDGSAGGYRDGRYRAEGDYARGQDADGGYRQGSEAGRQIATVIGGVAGAVLGSRVGGGNGRYVGTAVGTIAGGAAGRAIYDANNRGPAYRRGDVRVCEPDGRGSEDARVDGYDVTYEYAGRQYHARRDYHPGERIRVRVDVRAD